MSYSSWGNEPFVLKPSDSSFWCSALESFQINIIMKRATLFKNLEGKKVQCTACKQACKISPGHTGICGVRQNIDGTLHLIVYGKASAVNIDPIEKKPLFHFLPSSQVLSLGTVGCNFACSFCQNWDLSQITKDLKTRLIKEKKHNQMHAEVTKYGYELQPEDIVKKCVENKIPSIAYTYNEPAIFFEYLYDTAKLAKNKGIKNIFVSNGYESEEALEMIKPYLDGINVDLKAFTEEFYRKICHAKLAPVLETIKRINELGIWMEITTLVIPGKNDSDAELKKIAEFIVDLDKNIPWHISAFHPDYKMKDADHTPSQTLLRAYEIGKKAGLKYIYVGNILDEERASTYCNGCGELLIQRKGFVTTVKNFKNGKCTNCSEIVAGVWL